MNLRRSARRELTGRAWAGIVPFPRSDGHTYRPSGGQSSFHDDLARFRVLFGGRGSGKTTAGAHEALKYIRQGMSGAVLNPDFENFKASTWPEFRQWIPWSKVVPNDRRMAEHGWEPRAPFVIHFTNGVSVRCKGLKDPDAARGPNVSWLWYDEGGRDKTGMAWLLAIASVRIPGPNGEMPGAWVTTTPKGTRHWTAQWFVYQNISDAAQEVLDSIGYTGTLYGHHYASIHDNRANLDPLYYASLLSAYTGKFAQQELDGKLVDITEGVVYDCFGPDNVTTAAEYDPERGPVEIAYDDGFSVSPRVFLFIQRDGGTAYIFNEMYHLKHLAGTCIQEAKDLAAAGEWGPFEIAVGDPSASQLAAALRKADIVARGKSLKVKESIKVLYSLIETAEGTRRILVHPRCTNLIRELGQDYRYPEGSTSKSDVDPVKENDHGPDALRYWANMRMVRT